MIESLNDRFDMETKKIISSTGKIMTLGLGHHALSNNDFQYISQRFKLNFSELKAEVRILKIKKTKNFLLLSVVNGWIGYRGLIEGQLILISKRSCDLF